MDKKKAIIWFRNDLRLSDNLALDYAVKNGYEILFLYILDNGSKIGSASKWFLHQALNSLRQDLHHKYKAKLIIKSGESQDILDNLVRKYEVSTILYNKVYEPVFMARDLQLTEYFASYKIEVKAFNSSLLFEPQTIKTLSGDYYKVFTPFWRKCLSLMDNISMPVKAPEQVSLINLDSNDSLDLGDLALEPSKPNWAINWQALYKISERSAQDVAHEFISLKIKDYALKRNFPAADNTSFLSAYLHYGLISSKQLYYSSCFYESNEGMVSFLNEIGWREFAYYLLYHFPNLPLHNFKEKFNAFPWDNKQEYLKKWQKGQTGFPLIDAGMRQLWQTGWMHNRVRMVVASFLTKNLLIDWRFGADWFSDCLIDADLAINSMSWQWVAGCGVDAAPYFRIFNPITQSEKFDPSGSYIRKWLPEISGLSNKEIHFPRVREKYPEPMINLSESRVKALKIYKDL